MNFLAKTAATQFSGDAAGSATRQNTDNVRLIQKKSTVHGVVAQGLGLG